MQLNLLGKSVELVRKPEVTESQWSVISERIDQFIDLTNSADQRLTSDQKDVFRLTDKLVIFSEVQFRTHRMTRSFMDVQNREFYWATPDLLSVGYSAPPRVPCFYFHDAFHVRQWIRQDRGARLDQRIAREREATDRQLEVAVIMGADQILIDDLTDYRNSDERIKARLSTGVGMLGRLIGRRRYADHFPIL